MDSGRRSTARSERQLLLARLACLALSSLFPVTCSLSDLGYLRDESCAPNCGADSSAATDAKDSGTDVVADAPSDQTGDAVDGDALVDAGTGFVFRGSSSVPTIAGTEIVLEVPSGTVAGDLMVVFLQAYAHTPQQLPGWTPLLAQASPPPCNDEWLWMYRIAGSDGGAEPPTYTFALDGSASSTTGVMVSYGGIDGADPVDVAQQANWAAHETASLTTNYPGDLLLAMFGDSSTNGWQSQADDLTLVATSGVLGIFAGIQASPGPTGIKTAVPNTYGCGMVEFVAFNAK